MEQVSYKTSYNKTICTYHTQSKDSYYSCVNSEDKILWLGSVARRLKFLSRGKRNGTGKKFLRLKPGREGQQLTKFEAYNRTGIGLGRQAINFPESLIANINCTQQRSEVSSGLSIPSNSEKIFWSEKVDFLAKSLNFLCLRCGHWRSQGGAQAPLRQKKLFSP